MSTSSVNQESAEELKKERDSRIDERSKGSSDQPRSTNSQV